MSMSDPFESLAPGLESPATGAVHVSPSDTVNLATVSRALNAGTSGSVQVTMLDGGVVSLTIAAGSVLPVRVTRVWATGTTATGLVALF